MNKERRKRIADILDNLSSLRDDIEEVQSEEQEYYDNIPENMQQGEKAESSEAAISSMDDAMSSLDDAVASLEEIE